MFTTAIMLGFCSAIGVFVILLRLPRMLILRTLGYAWALDVFFTFLLFAMHWGSAVGGFSAVIGGLFCSLGITIAKCCLARGAVSELSVYRSPCQRIYRAINGCAICFLSATSIHVPSAGVTIEYVSVYVHSADA